MALTHTPAAADRAHLQLAAARAANTAGNYPAARDHAAAALAAFDDLHDEVNAGRAAAAQTEASVMLGDNAGAIAVAEPRWLGLQGRRDADIALLNLALVLTRAHLRLSDYDAMGTYAEQLLLLAEGANDHAALATALLRIGTRYSSIGAPAAAKLTYEAAAGLAREHDLLDPLGTITSNLAALLNSRNLPAALNYAREAQEAGRRSGRQMDIDYAISNYLIGSWLTGDITGTARVLQDALDTVTDPSVRATLRTTEVWVADANGQPVPEPGDDHNTSTDDLGLMVWQDNADLTRALAAGNPPRAATIVADSFPRLLSYCGLDDDFCVLWPPLVLAALAADDFNLAQQLLNPVEEAQPGVLSPAVAALWHRLRGLVAGARGDDPGFAENEMRIGISALDAFGARGYRGQAQEELARWLTVHDKPDDAAPLIAAARATYAQIGAAGWLARMDSRDTSRQPTQLP